MDSFQNHLIERARQASNKAYIPYSKFPVGAAAESRNGELFLGCNIENASLGLTMCAERTAIFSAVAQGHQDIARIAVSVPRGDKNRPETLMPCGACRQVMAQFMKSNSEVIIDGAGAFQLRDILPSPFHLD